MTITKKNYVLVDFENIQAMALERLESLPVSLVIFVGQNQKTISIDLFRQACAYTGTIEVIQSVAVGKNALDFQIVCYSGAISEKDPSAYIHFVSKDKGFDAVVQFLRSKGRFCARSDSFSELPFLAPKDDFKLFSIEQKKSYAIARLEKFPAASRPRKVKTLLSSLNASFGKQLDEHELRAVIDALSSSGHISVGAMDKISYSIQENRKQ